MPASPEALVRAYHHRLNQLRVASGSAVGGLWDTDGGLDDTSADRFATYAASTVTAAQTRTAILVDAYLASLIASVTGDPSTPHVDRTAVTGAAARNGADPVDVYRRAVITARRLVSEGNDYRTSMAGGRARAVSAAETDVMLTNRAAGVDVMSRSPHVSGYRRALSGRSCVLCAMASTNTYHTDQLQPIHSHCDCGIVPILGDTDPALALNRQVLANLKESGQAGKLSIDQAIARNKSQAADARERAAAKSGDRARDEHAKAKRYDDRADDLRSLRSDKYGEQRPSRTVTVHEHGELGPVLTDAGDHFTSQAAI